MAARDPDPRIEAFFADARNWRKELLALRDILRSLPLQEEFKWRAPTYTFGGGNVATIWSLKDNCALSFFKGILLKDPECILVAPGKYSRSVRMARFQNLEEIVAAKAILTDYASEAVDLETAGRKVEFRQDDFSIPDELAERIRADSDLKTAFEALTPGRQRGYVLHFSQPKKAETCYARIDKCRPRILTGKGMHER